MARFILAGQATAAKRQVYFHLVDATDGLTAETGEAGGQPQISSDGVGWTNTGIGVLVDIGNGRYYAELTQAAVTMAGTIIETRYKSANTAEAVGDQIHVVGFDLDTAAITAAGVADAVWDETLADHVAAGSTGEALSNLSAGDVGANTVTITVEDVATDPVADVSVSIFDSGNTVLQTRTLTNSSGIATVALDDATYKVRLSRSGYAFIVPETLTVSGDTADTYTATAVTEPADASAYEARHLRRQKVRYSDANTEYPLRYQFVLDGVKYTPASATITIYKPGSTTAVLDATAMTVSGTLCTYSVNTTTVADFPVGTGYRARIAATIAGVEHLDDIIFDVVKFILLLDIGKDQLLAMDDRLRAMDHNGDEDFSEIIEAVRDEMQLLLETKAVDGGPMLEAMFLDKSRVSIPARYLVLAQIFETKQNYEAADRYRKKFDSLWRQMLAGVKLDASQAQEETTSPQGLHGTRLRF